MSVDDHISFGMWGDYWPDCREEPDYLSRCTVLHETEKAVHVQQRVPGEIGGWRHCWIPKSQIERSFMDGTLAVGETLDIPITVWLEKRMFQKWQPMEGGATLAEKARAK